MRALNLQTKQKNEITSTGFGKGGWSGKKRERSAVCRQLACPQPDQLGDGGRIPDWRHSREEAESSNMRLQRSAETKGTKELRSRAENRSGLLRPEVRGVTGWDRQRRDKDRKQKWDRWTKLCVTEVATSKKRNSDRTSWSCASLPFWWW